MPILYEEMFQKKKVEGLAEVVDTTKDLTVTLASGKGTITLAKALDESNNVITKAYPGQKIYLYVDVQNTGDTDNMWASITDKDTGQIIVRDDGIPAKFPLPTSGEFIMNAGTHWGWPVGMFTMPNKQWNLLVSAGHGKA
jgi:hypothetical protein